MTVSAQHQEEIATYKYLVKQDAVMNAEGGICGIRGIPAKTQHPTMSQATLGANYASTSRVMIHSGPQNQLDQGTWKHVSAGTNSLDDGLDEWMKNYRASSTPVGENGVFKRGEDEIGMYGIVTTQSPLNFLHPTAAQPRQTPARQAHEQSASQWNTAPPSAARMPMIAEPANFQFPQSFANWNYSEPGEANGGGIGCQSNTGIQLPQSIHQEVVAMPNFYPNTPQGTSVDTNPLQHCQPIHPSQYTFPYPGSHYAQQKGTNTPQFPNDWIY